jgi:hypothetical protein
MCVHSDAIFLSASAVLPLLSSTLYCHGVHPLVLSHLFCQLNQVNNFFMTSSSSFWPVWGDNHLALFYNVPDTLNTTGEHTMDSLVNRLQVRIQTTTDDSRNRVL